MNDAERCPICDSPMVPITDYLSRCPFRGHNEILNSVRLAVRLANLEPADEAAIIKQIRAFRGYIIQSR